MTQQELDAAWASTRSAMKARGVRFRSINLSVPQWNVNKFAGYLFDGDLAEFMGLYEKALVGSFGDLSLGTVLIRQPPTLGDGGRISSRFGFYLRGRPSRAS